MELRNACILSDRTSMSFTMLVGGAPDVNEELMMPSLEGNPDPAGMVQAYVKALTARSAKLLNLKKALETIPVAERAESVSQFLGISTV